MCGITGIYSFDSHAKTYTQNVWNALQAIKHRGPDAQAVYEHDFVILGHTRLSIIDTSTAGNQPFTDASGRYTIIFNGEFYNFQSFYKELEQDGIHFTSTSDTEVLLYLYIKYGMQCLQKINGFFVFAVFDNVTHTLQIARDRMGVKPLYYYINDNFFCFCSEMSGLNNYPIEKQINTESLYLYLQLQYIPAPNSAIQNITKLLPGHYITIQNRECTIEQYYTLPYNPANNTNISYNQAQKDLYSLLNSAVQQRLIADVPLGTFLSGGIDSSIVSALASKHVSNLQTFSIGFKDNPYFDETKYANLTAKKIKSDHTVIQITTKDLENELLTVLDSLDEPFADSSAIAVYVLCKYVKQYVTVAISGDGADEVFAGYNKHAAHKKLLEKSLLNTIIPLVNTCTKHFPQSRNSSIGNIFRKINRFADGIQLTASEAYWRWCSVQSESDAKLFINSNIHFEQYLQTKNTYTSHFTDKNSTIQDVLYADQMLVLPNDMLTKVDRMSMANSLEVRSPFMDYRVIEFANNLPEQYKIDSKLKKKILQDTFREMLPIELYNRPKQGFEVPLHYWCTTVLQEQIAEYLDSSFIQKQQIFNLDAVSNLRKKLHSNNPGDSAAQVWALLVFQYWWKKHCK